MPFRHFQYVFASMITLLVVLGNWLYIFIITQNATMMSHYVIISPLFLYLFACINVGAGFGIYFTKIWGFIIAYLSILASCLAMILIFIIIPREEVLMPYYLEGLLAIDSLVVLYLIYFQRKTCSHKH